MYQNGSVVTSTDRWTGSPRRQPSLPIHLSASASVTILCRLEGVVKEGNRTLSSILVVLPGFMPRIDISPLGV